MRISVQHYHLVEQSRNNSISIKHIAGMHNPVDALSKALKTPLFKRHTHPPIGTPICPSAKIGYKHKILISFLNWIRSTTSQSYAFQRPKTEIHRICTNTPSLCERVSRIPLLQRVLACIMQTQKYETEKFQQLSESCVYRLLIVNTFHFIGFQCTFYGYIQS